MKLIDTLIEKFNHNHGTHGRFASGGSSGGGAAGGGKGGAAGGGKGGGAKAFASTMQGRGHEVSVASGRKGSVVYHWGK